MIKRLAIYILIILNFVFAASAKSDDVSSFGIEDMNIGDSLLDYFSNENIKKAKKNYYKSNKFVTIYVKKTFSTYDLVMVTVKNKDKNFKIYSLTGVIDYKYNIEDCYSMLDVIGEGIKDIYPSKDLIFKNRSHPADKTGNSKLTQYGIILNDGTIMAGCTDYSKKFEKEKNRNDFLMVSIKSDEFEKFINNKAY